MSDHKEAKSFSRFGYIMVAAGAAIGLGNIWKFPYLAYGDGGGAFVLIYIVICILRDIRSFRRNRQLDVEDVQVQPQAMA